MPEINIYHGNSLTAMESMEDKKYGLAICDPEYGGKDAIGIKNNKDNKKQAAKRTDYKVFKNIAPEKEYFEHLKRISDEQIIWGVNFYNNYDLSGGRICWDKKGTAFGRAELAYYSGSKSVEIFEYVWNGMIQGDMKNKEIRIHVTQKPVALYKWLLKNYGFNKDGTKRTIFDSHGGSMSIIIACIDLGFDIDIWEIDDDYYRDAVTRIKRHLAQQDLTREPVDINYGK